MTSRFASLIALGLSLTACGSDPLDPGAGDNAGKGTNTPHIEGRATAEPTIPNSQRDTDFRTDFSVRVRLNNVEVTSGTVTVTSRFGAVPLAYNVGENRWLGTGTGYDEVYQLDVVSGADKVENVIVDGPDLHKITAPTAGASLDSTMPNDLTWDRSEKCDVVSLHVGDVGLNIEDTGKYTMAPGALKAEKLMLLTDVEGVKDKGGNLLASIALADVPRLVDDGTISGGMIPKVECCVDALNEGVKKAHIVDGRVRHGVRCRRARCRFCRFCRLRRFCRFCRGTHRCADASKDDGRPAQAAVRQAVHGRRDDEGLRRHEGRAEEPR